MMNHPLLRTEDEPSEGAQHQVYRVWCHTPRTSSQAFADRL